MPDPSKLKVGDRVRFVALPEYWSKPGVTVMPECRAFMKAMIKRRSPSRVYEIDEYGVPWIKARVMQRGRIELHTWGINQTTGWRLVMKRRH